MALTQEQIKAEQERIRKMMPPTQARGRTTHRPDRMNLLERQYAEHLLSRMIDGEVRDFWFEAIKVRLADRCWYTADFLVQRTNGTLEIHETKSHMEDDAAVKLRLMPTLWWTFKLFIVRRVKGGGWTVEERT